ncbi:MAG: CRISPR-associated endonuclease Cas2 [Candidatus Anstonellales archaeon]
METIIIFYDITDDKLRNEVAELLKDYGLERIQKSAFMGYVQENKLPELQNKLEKLIKNDILHIVKLCNKCKNRIVEIGFAYLPNDKDYIIF